MEQILDAYNFINKVFKENYDKIKKVNAPFLEKEDIKPNQSTKKRQLKLRYLILKIILMKNL